MSTTRQIVCPHCHRTNKVPADRDPGTASCGACKQPLFSGQPLVLGAENFEKHLQHSDIPLLVDFWAPWCGPCKMFAPVFEQAAKQLEPRFRLVKVDTEQENALAARYNIRSIPTLALFAGGHEIKRQAGAMNLDQLVNWLQH